MRRHIHTLTQHIQQHNIIYIIISIIIVLTISFSIGYSIGDRLSKSSVPTQVEESAADLLNRVVE